MQVSDDLFMGPANAPNVAQGGPSYMENGVGPMGRVLLYPVVPVTLGAALLAALQTTGGAANLALTAGAGVTQAVADPAGVVRFVLDVPRIVTLTSTGNIAGVTFTVSGFDVYGQSMSEAIVGPNNNTVSGKKAFKSVWKVAAGGAVGTNTSVGIGDVFGMPALVSDKGYVVRAGWADALANDAGTFVDGDATSPATTTTGDVRGTYAPSSASNGVRRLVMLLALPGTAVGPLATRAGAFGVVQA